MPVLVGVVTRHWQLKLLAFAMAVMLWTVPRFEAQSRQQYQGVRVRVDLNDPEWALQGEPMPASVSVTLSGPARELIALAVDRPSVVIPVEEVTSTDTTVLLRFPWVRVPEGQRVTVEGIQPGSVRLAFEPIIDGEVVLAVRTSGELPNGLSLAGPIEVTPQRIRVSGPASRLEGLDSLYLETLDLALIRDSSTFTLPVDTTEVPGVSLSVTQASVHVHVEETLERVFPDLKLVPPHLETGPQLTVVPSTVTVTLAGARSLVEAVDSADLRLTLPVGRIRTLSPGEEERFLVGVEGVPPYVRVVRVDPGWVLLRRPAGL